MFVAEALQDIRHASDGHTVKRLTSLLLATSLLLVACADGRLAGSVVEGTLPSSNVSLSIVDEGGNPIDAQLTLTDGSSLETVDGRLELTLTGPVAGVLEADGMLTHPVVVDHTRSGTVRMFARIGADGTTRRSFHFAGDTMLARRFLEDVDDPGSLAEEVVDDIADLFAAADHSTVNLETVVGTLPNEAESPGKRWAIQSTPEIIRMLDRLGVDLVTLGNNHIGDFGDPGLESTLEYLDVADIESVGAGVDESAAARPIAYEVEALQVSTSSFLLPDGNSNNDSLPLTGEDELMGEDERLDWQYEYRDVQFTGPVSDLAGRVRAGDAWVWFRENASDDSTDALLWEQAESVFPELQDFGARRAHGGAALHDEGHVAAGLESVDAQLSIVQLHGGFQYRAAPSRGVIDAARHAIDAGADLVVAHHPHVLGGFEFYGDGLILWSLGNFVFDQELFVTYRSAFARLIYEGDRLLDASFIPVYLVDYRPVPAAGTSALETARYLAALATNDTVTVGVEGGDPAETPRGHEVRAGSVRLRSDGSIAMLGEPAEARSVRIPESGVLTLGSTEALVNPGDSGFEIGRDLFGWGSFEQTVADGEIDRAPMWNMDGAAGFSWNTRGSDGYLIFDPATAEIGRVRIRSRIPLTQSRYVGESGRPLQAAPRIEVSLWTAASWLTEFNVRVDTYHFSDRNPARYPVNVRLSSRDYEATIGRAQSQILSFDVPRDQLVDPDTGLEATAMLLYVENPSTRLGTLEIDDVAVIEWRPANEFLYEAIIDADVVIGPAGAEIRVIDLAG